MMDFLGRAILIIIGIIFVLFAIEPIRFAITGLRPW